MTTAPPADRSDLVVRRFLLVAVWLPVALVAVGVAVQLVLLPQVPSTVAIHWNATGEPDGFAPAWTQPLATIGFGLGLPLLIALTVLPGLRRGERGATYRLMGATAAAVSALTTVAFTTTFALQVGLDSADDAPSVWQALVASLASAVAVGVAAWFLQPRQDAATGHPAPATPLALSATERAVWVRTTAMNTGGAVAVVVAALAVAVAAAVAWLTGGGAVLAGVLTVLALALLALAATTLAFHVRVDGTGLHVDSLLGIPRFHVPLAEIDSASRVEVTPMAEFGGWGVRIAPHGRRFGVVLRAGEAIEVLRRSGKRFVVTVDDAGTGAALLEALVERAGARP
ncbi:DUF1648 domain-containing protein [Microbacterium hibisci]|uniref:DUF1648 domain-containing protein n=1 Tax=Microbacterium hibisci TaxID=2036000 RepID=UPI0019418C13|nr:DUF1648 domain-containing protein [Microbacterium hibisci]